MHIKIFNGKVNELSLAGKRKKKSNPVFGLLKYHAEGFDPELEVGYSSLLCQSLNLPFWLIVRIADA